jgi:hypothetical protein
MSDMQFRAVRKRADKSESEKATVSELVGCPRSENEEIREEPLARPGFLS